MLEVAAQHLARVRTSVAQRFGLSDLGRWICEHTKLNGEPYSFVDHEYQARIAGDASREIVVRKCSQVGLSELSSRLALAYCAVVPSFTVIYTLPTAGFARKFMTTRIDPTIESSGYLSGMLHTAMDNSEVKRLGNSYLYMNGCQSDNAPISVPADLLVHDEVDFSSPEVISQYQSRLTHSKHKKKLKLSTPTIPKRGIDREFSQSRRHFNFCKCHHCGHHFLPDYFEHVKVPDWSDSLMKITKANLHRTRYEEARVLCPHCGSEPDLSPAHREWVCENPSDRYVAAGYQVSPFDAPAIISPAYLIEASTTYKRYIDFVNFNLGLPAEDKESTLTAEELRAALIEQVGSAFGSYVFGLDMGMVCWLSIGFRTLEGILIIVKTEGIPVHRLRERLKELRGQYRPRVTVVDALPYTETVLALQSEDMNLFGAVYVRSKNMETHAVREKEEDKETGQVEVRQVNVNRDKAFDAFMQDVRAGLILKVSEGREADETWVDHLTDMKRVKEFTADAELSFVWRKSEDGNDHLHHSGLYLWVASQMLGVSKTGIALPMGVRTFKVAPKAVDA